MFIIPMSLGLIFILLYMAFHSLIDAIVVFRTFSTRGRRHRALYLTGTTSVSRRRSDSCHCSAWRSWRDC